MEISSLSSLCLESVADNMAMWCESAVKEDFYKYLYAIGPFNELDSKMTQQILNISHEKQKLKASYFPLLFHEKITKLDLSRCHSMITDQVLKLVCLRCKKLTQLNLNGCTRLSTACLNETLPTLKSLRSLQLSNCRGSSDELLYNLRTQCCKLQELVVNLCSKVTDAGIEALLRNERLNNVGFCGIVHLNVSATSVTTKCLGMILSRLPKLRKLCFSDIENNEKTPLRFVDMYLLNIEYLDISATFVNDADLKLLIGHSPKLAVLKLNSSNNLSNYIANHLTSLVHVTSLDLAGASEEVFFEDVKKFLEKRGDRLESLNLSGIHNVRVSVLCLYCVSLMELDLTHCQNVDPMVPAVGDMTEEERNRLPHGNHLCDFCPRLSCIKLNFATFLDNVEAEMNSIWISGLLRDHPYLRKLSLNNVDINDEVVGQICESSSSLVLETLDLKNCDGITVKGVWDVIEKCLKLRLLDLSHCKQIDLGSILQIKKNLKKSRSPLQIVWV